MVWVEFFAASLVIVIAANKLADYGNVIALRTGLGGMFVGTLLLAGATSLPELLTGINSINQGVPDLTVGNIFGSSMFNIAMLGMLDLLYRQGRILRVIAINHSLSAGLAIVLTGLAIFFIEAKIEWELFGYIGTDTVILIGAYVLGTNLIHQTNRSDGPPPEPDPEELAKLPSLTVGLGGFVVATGVLIFITPYLVESSIGIAEVTGLSTGFVGLALVAVVTSLPELATTISAVRIGAVDMAVGNLFGSNIFNVFALALTDFFYTDGSFLYDIDPLMSLAGQLALILTALALIGILARADRRTSLAEELDGVLILVIYGLGMWFLYSKGVVG